MELTLAFSLLQPGLLWLRSFFFNQSSVFGHGPEKIIVKKYRRRWTSTSSSSNPAYCHVILTRVNFYHPLTLVRRSENSFEKSPRILFWAHKSFEILRSYHLQVTNTLRRREMWLKKWGRCPKSLTGPSFSSNQNRILTLSQRAKLDSTAHVIAIDEYWGSLEGES